MNHEPECTAWGESKINPTTCYACGIARAAYQRGREDAAEAMHDHFNKSCVHWTLDECIAAAREDGEQSDYY